MSVRKRKSALTIKDTIFQQFRRLGVFLPEKSLGNFLTDANLAPPPLFSVKNRSWDLSFDFESLGGFHAEIKIF